MEQTENRAEGPPALTRNLLLAAAASTVVVGALVVFLHPWRDAAAPPVAVPSASTPAASVAEAAAEPSRPSDAAEPAHPSFDVVRVNDEGSAVIAGRATAHAMVTILDNGNALGQVAADDVGQFVFLPEQPLPSGGQQLTLAARSPDGLVSTSEAAVLLLVPDRTADAARQPGAPVAVLEAPDAPPKLLTPAPVAAAQAPAPEEPAVALPAEVATAATPASALPPVASSPSRSALASAPPSAAAPPPAAPASANPGGVTATLQPPAVLTSAGAPPAPAVIRLPEVADLAPLPEVPPPVNAPALLTPPALPAAADAPPTPAALHRRLALEVVDYDDHGAIRFAGGAPAGRTVRLYVDNRPAGDATADAVGRWTLTPPDSMPLGVHKLRVDQLNAQGRVTARVEQPFQRSIVDPASIGRDRVLVQPGQNLWRLARVVYGSGTRYTVIYQANRDQIRDPRLIYPGQAFAVPGAVRAVGSSPASIAKSR